MKGKNVIVAGAGKSGVASVGLLIRNGANVTLFDGNKNLKAEELLKNFSANNKVNVALGELTDELIQWADLFVISPGIPVDADFVNRVREAGVPIWGEIELAYYFNKGKIAAITGTNGKTTTTTLVGEIFKKYTENTIVVGNIGLPFTQFADTTNADTMIAAEISSFQLETVVDFHPHVSAILNLTPDHLNRHYTFDNYANAKLRIQENQTADDFCILNYDDPETLKRADKVKKAKKIFFSKTEEIEDGVYMKDGVMVVNHAGEEIPVIDASEIKILGDHNKENVLAAIAVTYYMGVPKEIIADVIRSFQGVEHRIEFVRELNDVKYYNDSKGTNPDAAIKALRSMPSTTCLIGGGYDKKNTYDEWVDEFAGKVRFLVLIGETADDIEKCCKNHGFNEIVHADTLEDAVEICSQHAKPGDNVLLSPACASWDMFKSYEQRGELFKEYVNRLG